MTQYGKQTSFYLQKELEENIYKIVKNNPEIYKSRNHFVNCAIIRQIKHHNQGGQENDQ